MTSEAVAAMSLPFCVTVDVKLLIAVDSALLPVFGSDTVVCNALMALALAVMFTWFAFMSFALDVTVLVKPLRAIEVALKPVVG